MHRFALTNVTIFTVDPEDRVIANGTVLIDDGCISALGPKAEIEIPSDMPSIDCGGRKALLPGLVDAHSHSSLMRGISENMQLMEWLPYYQREFRALTPEDAYHAARLSYLEALKNGTTCVMDMYRIMDRCAEAGREIGLRVNLAPYVADRPGLDFFATLDENRRLIDSHHGANNGRIQVWMGLEHLFYCSADAYAHALACAREFGLKIHTHACEQKEEEAAVTRHFGKRSIAMLDQYGVLGENTLLAHCVWLNDDEIKLLADTGTRVAHCPVSNAKLASGVARLPEMLDAGIPVGLGTDGNVCNNSLDLFEEMKFASLIQKATRLDPMSLPASQMLRLATLGGAEVLGLDDKIGSLEVGKRADMILLDIGAPNLTPYCLDEKGGNLLWNLVFSARGSNVTDVWVDGECLISDGEPTRVSQSLIVSQAQVTAHSLIARCDELPPNPSVMN
ncbi:amidohydrolase family protein [Marinobacterium sp. YM272]|uniref:amidohydrolase family protein n=1 Tax=Marinobacterium sp. YM272 TaxID=3421654 RepID=UPI003D7F70B5